MTLAPGEEEILKKSACLSAAIFLAWGDTAFADEFQNLKCGADIPKAMIGKHSSNGPVVEFEKKYRALGLKGLGADEISDQLSSVSWLICGAEYVELIDRRGLVRDVVPFPPHSKSAPAFSGICQASTSADPLPVKTAWKIDQKAARFVPVSEGGLTCPRSGIYTVDGGS
jgi:hypothetical protein